MNRQTRPWVLGLVLLAVLAWWLLPGLGRPSAAPVAVTPSGAPTPTRVSKPPNRSGLDACPMASLPREVARAVSAVRANGPYLRSRADGAVFGNRERLLPSRPSGWYREYTVEAPGQRFPGPRRLVTGGQERLGDEPAVWFYTADHYESFCELLV